MGKDVIVACDFDSAEATFAFLDKFADCSRNCLIHPCARSYLLL